MSQRWYRAYAGTVTDPKLGEVALVAGCLRATAIAAWHALLESATDVNDGGRYDTTPRRVAVILGELPAVIEAVFAEFENLGMIGGGCITAWKRRQFESDTSAERTRRYRERRKDGAAASRDDDVTSHIVTVTAPYTDTDTEKAASAACARAAPEVQDPPPAENRDPPRKRDRAWMDALETRLREAAGLETDAAPNLCVVGPIVGLIDAGADLEADILPVLRAKAKSGVKARSWSFYVPAIQDAMKARRGAGVVAMPPRPRDETPVQLRKRLGRPEPKDIPARQWERPLQDFFLSRGANWSEALFGPPPGQPGCVAPPDIVERVASQNRWRPKEVA